MKRRRGKMKSHEYCFSGVDAVDVIFQFLSNDESRFNQKDMSREKATKVHTCAHTVTAVFVSINFFTCRKEFQHGIVQI